MKIQSKYWVRTMAGLENIFIQELAEVFSFTIIDIKHKSVFFELRESTIAENQLVSCLKTADDIYQFIGSCNKIDNTKISTENIIKYFEKNVLPILKNTSLSFIRVTVSFLGKRNFNRFYIENSLNKLLESQTKSIILSNEKEEKWKEGEKRIRIHLEDDKAYFGISLQDKPLHRRQWRVNSYPAQLHPPLAAAMTLIAKPSKGMLVIDPYCGSGTILIESAIRDNSLQHLGFDINKTAIQIATENSNMANTNIEFFNDDFFNKYKTFSDYIVITNPPWGEKHIIDPKQENVFLDKLIAVISKSQVAVILIPHEYIIKLKNKGIAMKEVLQTRVRGKIASVIVIL